jgi:hypothetical protein
MRELQIARVQILVLALRTKVFLVKKIQGEGHGKILR